MNPRRFAFLSASILALTPLSHAQATYTGDAVVAKVNVLGILNTSIQDTGALPSSGGSLATDLLSLNVPDLLSIQLLAASTNGQSSQTNSAASVTQLSLSAAGVHIAASILASNASANCGPSVSGHSTVVGLKVNGLSINVTGAPNQTIPLLVGSLVINEQSSSVNNQPGSTSADMLVTALHLKVNFLADVAISQAHAGVRCSNELPQ